MIHTATAADPLFGHLKYDFYQCQRCYRICTSDELSRALGKHGTGSACPCGGMKYSPVNLPWYGLCWPRVWAPAWRRLVGGLRGWRMARAECLACGGSEWQARFRRGSDTTTLECPACHAQHSLLTTDISFADAPETV